MPSTTTDRLNGLSTSLAVKAPVQAVATENITLYGAQTINGKSVVAGDRVLVTAQTNGVENGIYDVSATTWSRSADFDGARDIVGGTIVIGPNDGGTGNWLDDATAETVGEALYPITDAETTAGVTISAYRWPPGDVRRYGTNTSPGTTDMTAAVQAAVDQADDGTPASVPAGTFSVGLIDVAGQLSLVGEGPNSILKQNDLTASAVVRSDPSVQHDSIYIDNLVIDGNRSLGSYSDEAHGLDLGNFTHVHIGRLEVKNCWGHGVRIRRCQNVIIDSLYVHDCGKMGLNFEDASEFTQYVHIGQVIAHSNGYTPGDGGLYWSGVDVNDLITGATVGPRRIHLGSILSYGNSNNGIALGRNSITGNTGPVDLTFDTLHAYDNDFHGVEFYGVKRCAGGTIKAYDNGRIGVYVGIGDDLDVQSDKISIGTILAHGNGYHGVDFSVCSNVEVGSIQAFNNSYGNADTYAGVAFYAGAGTVTSPKINENINIGSILAFDDQGSPTQKYGVQIIDGQATGQHVYVGRLRAYGNVTADVMAFDADCILEVGDLDAVVVRPLPTDNVDGAGIRNATLKVRGRYVGVGKTTDAAATNLVRIPVPSEYHGGFESHVVCNASSDGYSTPRAVYHHSGHIVNTGSTQSVVTSTPLLSSESTADLDVQFISGGAGAGYFTVQVTGVAATNIDWYASVELTRKFLS